MNLIIRRDLNDVNWQEMTEVYQKALSPLANVEGVKKEFNGSDLVCFAVVDGRIIGGGHAIVDGRDGCIFGVAVHPEFQCRGIGTRLMRELLGELEGFSVILNAGPRSESFYRRLGFRRLKHAMALRYGEEDFVEDEPAVEPIGQRHLRYDRKGMWREFWGPGGLELAEQMAAAMKLPADSLVLDVGAGSGEISCFLAKEFGWRIIALEHWGGMDVVNAIQAKANGRGLLGRVTAIHADARNLSIATESVDGVFCEGVFEMLQDDRPGALKEMMRVVREGGPVGIGEPNWTREPSVGDMREICGSEDHEFGKCFRTVDWTAQLMRDAGLNVTTAELRPEGARWWAEFYQPWEIHKPEAKDELEIWRRDGGRLMGIGIVVGSKVSSSFVRSTG